MMSPDFDPWAEIQRLRRRPAKAANPAKPDSDLSRFSRFSPEEARHRCARCRALSVQGVETIRCLGCGFTRPALVARPSLPRPRHQSGGRERFPLVDTRRREADDG